MQKCEEFIKQDLISFVLLSVDRLLAGKLNKPLV